MHLSEIRFTPLSYPLIAPQNAFFPANTSVQWTLQYSSKRQMRFDAPIASIDYRGYKLNWTCVSTSIDASAQSQTIIRARSSRFIPPKPNLLEKSVFEKETES